MVGSNKMSHSFDVLLLPMGATTGAAAEANAAAVVDLGGHY